MNKKIHIFLLFQFMVIIVPYSAIVAQVISNNGALLTITSGTQISNVGGVVNTSGTIENEGVITITSDLTNNSTISGNGVYNIAGNFTNNNVFTAGTSTVSLNGVSSQTVSGTSVTTFNILNINNSNGISLGTNSNVSGVLNFTSGVVNTNANKISITSTGSIVGAGTSKFVNGFLEKYIPVGAGVTADFEIGNGSTDYLPLNLNFSNVTGAGNFTGSANNGDHSDIANVCFDPTKSVNRNWTLTNTGTAFTNYSANANFLVTDKDAGSNSANYFMAIKNTGTWNILTQGALTATSTQGTGITTDGDLQIAEKLFVGTPIFAIGATSERCRIGGVETYSATAANATGITYSLDAASLASGNVINAATGQVTYLATYSGTSTITATAAGCFGPLTSTHTAVTTTLPVNSTSITGIACLSAPPINQTYSIAAVGRASYYTWTIPTGASILSGQGTNTITVNFASGWVNGIVTVTPQNACGSAVTVTKKDVATGGAPTKPGTASGPTVVCSYIGVGTAVYSVAAVMGASSYNWVKPTSCNIVSGQGTNFLTVNFNTAFSSGQFSVASLNGCGSSAFSYFTVSKVGLAPLSITGIANAYGKTDNSTLVNYTTPVINGASSYNWTVPANVTIASGQGTTSVNLKFAPAFTGGSIGVASVSACGNSPILTKTIANNTTTPLSDLDYTVAHKNVSCNGLHDGEATISINGGLPPYAFVWNTLPIQTSEVAKNLKAGTYTVKVTDNSGHSFMEEVVIYEPSELNANAIKLNNSSYNLATGQTTASVLGGTGNYQYSWNTNPIQNTQVAKELKAGVYTVTVKDENSCISHSSIVISDSLTDINSSATTKVYPIPAVNQFTVDYASYSNLANTLTVISYDGKILFNSPIPDQSSVNMLVVDCGAWSRGVYYVIIKDKNDLILSSKPVVLVR
jgi:PKD-like domain/SprB repeat